MLQYAVEIDTGKLVHVSDVPNGHHCGCICPNPECADQLSAKNKSDKYVAKHFAHQTRNEGKTCLMSQLHLGAQHHFLTLTSFTLPKHAFFYHLQKLHSPAKPISIHGAELEAPIGKYRADVLLETDIGRVLIEILVTSECSEEKIEYLRSNELPTLLIDLSSLINADIPETLNSLEKGDVPSKWIYGWSQSQLIDTYRAEQADTRRKLLASQRQSARRSARKLISDKRVLLPPIHEKLQCVIDNVVFEQEEPVFRRKEFEVASLDITHDENEFLLLKGKASNTHEERSVWIAYLYTEEANKQLQGLEGAVIMKTPRTDKNSKPTWRWYHHPRLQIHREIALREFEKKCRWEMTKRRSTNTHIGKVEILASRYAQSQDDYFKAGYSKWKRWLVANHHFTPSEERSNPPYPPLLRTHRNPQNLWMFDAWYVHVITMLACIVDRTPINEPINLTAVFNSLAVQFPLTHEYLDMAPKMSEKFLERHQCQLVFKEQVIGATLNMFANTSAIRRVTHQYIITGSVLSELLKGM